MRILFVLRAHQHGINPVMKNQALSLEEEGVSVDFFQISGKGVKSYLRNYYPLRQKLKQTSYDIVHSHFGFSAFLTTVTNFRPHVVSLMGSDLNRYLPVRMLIKFCQFTAWNHCIVKSEEMRQLLGTKKKYVSVLPNGVNTDRFRPIDKHEAVKHLGWSHAKKHILFAANPERSEKNYSLFEQAVINIHEHDIEVHHLVGIDNNDVPCLMNASDVIVLTSLWEGSPNVIKEAMACCRPIVSTNVGDVEWLFGGLPGHYLTDFNKENVIANIKDALVYSTKKGKTKGRERIMNLHLNSGFIAKQLLQIYNKLIE